MFQSFCSVFSDVWLFNTRCVLSPGVLVILMMLFDDAVNCGELVYHKWLRSVKITHPQFFGKLQSDKMIAADKTKKLK